MCAICASSCATTASITSRGAPTRRHEKLRESLALHDPRRVLALLMRIFEGKTPHFFASISTLSGMMISADIRKKFSIFPRISFSFGGIKKAEPEKENSEFSAFLRGYSFPKKRNFSPSEKVLGGFFTPFSRCRSIHFFFSSRIRSICAPEINRGARTRIFPFLSIRMAMLLRGEKMI